MKIKIDDDYLNLNEDFTLVVEDYSKEEIDEDLDKKFEQSSKSYNDENNYFVEESSNKFKVEIQYLEDDVPNNTNDESNNYNISSNNINSNNSSEKTTNYKAENYEGVINDKYKEYDKFCYNQQINYNYDSNIIYDEPLNNKLESEEILKNNKYNSCNCEKEVEFIDECNSEEKSNNIDVFEFTQELNERKINKKPNNEIIYEEKCEVRDNCLNNEFEKYNNESEKYNDKLEKYNNESEKYNNESEKYNNESEKYNDKLEKYNNEFEKYNNEFEKYNDESEKYYKNNFEHECGDNYSYSNNYKVTRGEIKVSVKLGDKNGIEIKGAKINLYELNGVCPKLYESRLTDCNGEITFNDLENGCYRVIAIVDRRFFEKPKYINWNEVTIDNFIKCANICVINRLKPSCLKR